MNTSSSSATPNRPTCTSCGSFSCHKRISSKNPNTHLEPNPKKANNGTHSVFDFSKIPHYPSPFLRRRYNPTLPPVLEEPIKFPETPMSTANTSPPRLPTSKRSPAKTFSSSSDSPHLEWLRKMRDCIREMSRKCDELLGTEEDAANEETYNSNAVNNLSHNTMDNSEEEYVIEAVSVEKKGEALILHFKCPCGSGYQILLFGGNCYYKLMEM